MTETPVCKCPPELCRCDHRLRLENAMYTAAEVKVLTEAALRLGRAEAGEEIAKALESRDAVEWVLSGSYAGIDAAHIARMIGTNPTPQPSGAASDATSVPSEGPGTSEPSKAAKTPQEPS